MKAMIERAACAQRRMRSVVDERVAAAAARLRAKAACESGQGTTEYAILVGV